MTAKQRAYWLREIAWLRDVLGGADGGRMLGLEIGLTLWPVVDLCERMLREDEGRREGEGGDPMATTQAATDADPYYLDLAHQLRGMYDRPDSPALEAAADAIQRLVVRDRLRRQEVNRENT